MPCKLGKKRKINQKNECNKLAKYRAPRNSQSQSDQICDQSGLVQLANTTNKDNLTTNIISTPAGSQNPNEGKQIINNGNDEKLQDLQTESHDPSLVDTTKLQNHLVLEPLMEEESNTHTLDQDIIQSNNPIICPDKSSNANTEPEADSNNKKNNNKDYCATPEKNKDNCTTQDKNKDNCTTPDKNKALDLNKETCLNLPTMSSENICDTTQLNINTNTGDNTCELSIKSQSDAFQAEKATSNDEYESLSDSDEENIVDQETQDYSQFSNQILDNPPISIFSQNKTSKSIDIKTGSETVKQKQDYNEFSNQILDNPPISMFSQNKTSKSIDITTGSEAENNVVEQKQDYNEFSNLILDKPSISILCQNKTSKHIDNTTGEVTVSVQPTRNKEESYPDNSSCKASHHEITMINNVNHGPSEEIKTSANITRDILRPETDIVNNFVTAKYGRNHPEDISSLSEENIKPIEPVSEHVIEDNQVGGGNLCDSQTETQTQPFSTSILHVSEENLMDTPHKLPGDGSNNACNGSSNACNGSNNACDVYTSALPNVNTSVSDVQQNLPVNHMTTDKLTSNACYSIPISDNVNIISNNNADTTRNDLLETKRLESKVLGTEHNLQLYNQENAKVPSTSTHEQIQSTVNQNGPVKQVELSPLLCSTLTKQKQENEPENLAVACAVFTNNEQKSSVIGTFVDQHVKCPGPSNISDLGSTTCTFEGLQENDKINISNLKASLQSTATNDVFNTPISEFNFQEELNNFEMETLLDEEAANDNFEQEFNTRRKQALDDIESRRAAGTSLVKSVAANLLVINKQLLQLKKQMEAARRSLTQQQQQSWESTSRFSSKANNNFGFFK